MCSLGEVRSAVFPTTAVATTQLWVLPVKSAAAHWKVLHCIRLVGVVLPAMCAHPDLTDAVNEGCAAAEVVWSSSPCILCAGMLSSTSMLAALPARARAYLSKLLELALCQLNGCARALLAVVVDCACVGG